MGRGHRSAGGALPARRGLADRVEQVLERRAVAEAAGDIAVLQAPNMSLGVNLMFKVAEQLAKTLADEYDIEIVEDEEEIPEGEIVLDDEEPWMLPEADDMRGILTQLTDSDHPIHPKKP